MSWFRVVNPRAGDDRPSTGELVRAAAARGIRAHVLGPGEDPAKVARAAAADAIGVAGGDGSLAAVAAVALERDVPFVCVPLGTRNHFALDVGLDRDDPIGALAAFSGRERRVDIGRTGGRLFLNNVSFGLYASLVAEAKGRRGRAGEPVEREPAEVGDVVRGPELAADDARLPVEVQRRPVTLARAVAVDPDADERARLHREAGLLAELAAEAVERVLVLLEKPARKVPAAAVRLVGPPAEEDAAVAVEADRTDRRRRVRVGDEAARSALDAAGRRLEVGAASGTGSPAVENGHNGATLPRRARCTSRRTRRRTRTSSRRPIASTRRRRCARRGTTTRRR